MQDIDIELSVSGSSFIPVIIDIEMATSYPEEINNVCKLIYIIIRELSVCVSVCLSVTQYYNIIPL